MAQVIDKCLPPNIQVQNVAYKIIIYFNLGDIMKEIGRKLKEKRGKGKERKMEENMRVYKVRGKKKTLSITRMNKV